MRRAGGQNTTFLDSMKVLYLLLPEVIATLT